MRRNFLTGLIICLIPTVISAYFVFRAFDRESKGEAGFRRGIDLAGGTILVYEVDTRKTLGNKSETRTSISTEDIRKLAENLKRRIDPSDLKNVVVRPVGDTRVELILPRSASVGGKAGSNDDDIQEVKSLVRQVGQLEFRILANTFDDDEGIQEAQKFLNEQTPEQARDFAKRGDAPPAPSRKFSVLGDDDVEYEWLELGKEERESLHLHNNAEKDASDDGSLWRVLKSMRGKPYLRETKKGTHNGELVRKTSFLLYSRDFVKDQPDEFEKEKKVEYFILTRVSKVDNLRVGREHGLTALATTDRKMNPNVQFDFGPEGARIFGKMTERNRPADEFVRNLAIVMDGKIVSAPTLNAVLSSGGSISGESFKMKDVNRLVHILRSGALNAELKPDPVSENTIGPTLGQDTIRKGLSAVALAFFAILGFMVFYYRFSGFVACVALFANLLMTIGFMISVNAAFTLPGLAGIVLTLGMAVDANVLIYERLREERERGANLLTAIRNGYDRALPTIIDTHLTSIFTAIVLYILGNDNLKGFSVSLTVGLVISLFTALYMTRIMFDFWMHKKWLTELAMLKLFARPNFDFMRIRHLMFATTATLTVLGLGLFLARIHTCLNVDFTQGTAYGGRLKDGEARHLSGSGGKMGLLDLLSEQRQAERLKVKEVESVNRSASEEGSTQQRADAGYVYKIVYDDGDKAVVTLANLPEGTTEEAQREQLKERASRLPGLSVEQVFLSNLDKDLEFGMSRSFTVRTTEKESDLVQIMLDRLLRDEKTNEPLLNTSKVTSQALGSPVSVLTLDKPAAPRRYAELLMRELRILGRVPLGNAPLAEVTGIPSTDPAVAALEASTGQFSKIKVDVTKNPEFKGLVELATKVGETLLNGKKTSENPAAFDAALKTAIATDDKARGDLAALTKAIENATKSFETRPAPDRLETFDPALASDTRDKAFWAVLVSWMAILGYLWFRFGSWTFGAAAVICLIHDLCFTLGCIAVCHYLHDLPFFGPILKLQDFKIDLVAVAALLTLVGYSVSDTIVVFDRIREVRGKNPSLTPKMINDSVNGTLSRTVLASLTVFLVVGVLYFFGGEGVHLFSFTMVVGVIVGTYSSIYIASPLLLIFGEGAEIRPTGERAVTGSTSAAAAKSSTAAVATVEEETLG